MKTLGDMWCNKYSLQINTEKYVLLLPLYKYVIVISRETIDILITAAELKSRLIRE